MGVVVVAAAAVVVVCFYKPALGAAHIFGSGYSSDPAVCKPPHDVGGATLMKIGQTMR